jgi:hypothetical protein
MSQMSYAHGGMAILLIVRESETFYLKSTTTNLWESKMSYTKNELALIDFVDNINKYFYYIGEDDDIIPNPRFEVREKLDSFTSQFMKSIEVEGDDD